MNSEDPPRRRILFLTGTRADFGKLKSLMEHVEASEAFEAQIFATGMHMLARYGSTVNEIRKAGFENIFTYINQDSARDQDMDLVLANTISGLGYYLREFEPDLLVVHGDRVETLAGATVGALHNVLVAHVEGGEISGTVDELLRHATSKLAHLHFVSNALARQRLLQMGELPESVFVIGSPEVDVMLSDRLPPLSEVKARYEIPFDDYGICSYHPVTTEVDQLEAHAAAVVEALRASERNYVVIYPNNDTGAETIMKAITPLAEEASFRVLPSMRFEHYLTLMKHADVVVGNSSSGVREAPVYGTPTVNVGTRQRNRSPYPSIVNVPEERDRLVEALAAPPRDVAPSRLFGQGNSADLFMEHLRDPDLWARSRQKQFRDMFDVADGQGVATGSA